MLYWHFRNIQCIFLAFFKSKLPKPNTPVTKTFWANPFDSDWLQSIQAGQFFTYTDAARWELAIRSGFFKPAIKNKWVVIIGGQKIINRNPIKIFRKFDLTMQFIGWDEKWIYAAHIFRQGGQAKCCSFTKIGIRGQGKLVSPLDVFSDMGHPKQVVPPDSVVNLFKTDIEVFEDLTDMMRGI